MECFIVICSQLLVDIFNCVVIRFKLSVSKLIDLKYNLHVIDSVCRSDDNRTMLHRCAVVWELMLARDNLVHISDLSGSSFSSADVVTMLDWACVY